MSEQRFPFIGRLTTSLCTAVLFYENKDGEHASGIVLESDIHNIGKFSDEWTPKVFTDITIEYLNNTIIKIESKEQSEFIQNLAFSLGYKWKDFELEKLSLVRQTNKSFLILKNNIISYANYTFGDEDEREIDLPYGENNGIEITEIEPTAPIETEFNFKVDISNTKNTYLLKDISDFNKLNNSTEKNLGIPDFPCIAVGYWERELSNHDYNYTFLSISRFDEV
jgi:hypothetical protein